MYDLQTDQQTSSSALSKKDDFTEDQPTFFSFGMKYDLNVLVSTRNLRLGWRTQKTHIVAPVVGHDAGDGAQLRGKIWMDEKDSH